MLIITNMRTIFLEKGHKLMEKYELTPNCIERIEKICKQNNWTIYKLSQLAGIPYSSLNNMINRGTDPTINTLSKLCYALNITLSEFFSEDDFDVMPINEDLKFIISSYNSLTAIEQAQVKAYIQGITDKHKYS